MSLWEFIFVLLFCATVLMLRSIRDVWKSPEFQSDLERLRANRRLRRAARRRR